MAALMRACLVTTAVVAVAASIAEDDECSALQIRSTSEPLVSPPLPHPAGCAEPELAPVNFNPEDVFVDDPEGLEIEAAAIQSSVVTCAAPYRACEETYRMHPECAFPFEYRGDEHDSCIPSIFGGRWCSLDPVYQNFWTSWERCHKCFEQSNISGHDQWQALAQNFACWNIVITGGTSLGRRAFTFINGFPTETTAEQFPAFSGGKWPGTVAIAGAVHTGHLSWDTRAAEVFEWWTKDAGDPRSRVTLRNLLHFSSGFYFDSVGMGHIRINCMGVHLLNDQSITMEECAQEVYENAQFDESRIGKWGDDVFNYNSMHQVIALAMATKRTGLCPSDYLRKYLFEPAEMTSTTVYPVVRPILSAFMYTTVDDYDNFLSNYLSYKILPKEIVDVIETDSGNGAGTWINGMGINVGDTAVSWGGSLFASVHRNSSTYQLISPPVTEYPGGAIGKWSVVHPLIERYLEEHS